MKLQSSQKYLKSYLMFYYEYLPRVKESTAASKATTVDESEKDKVTL